MNKGPIFLMIVVALGIFLWFQRDELAVHQSSSGTANAAPPLQGSERFIIREKIKPGGYIGWHTTENDQLTQSARQTRQASHYYFVCTEIGSGTQRVFMVNASAFNMERIGNVLTSEQVRSFQEVSTIEEPPLDQGFEFRRRD